jgi:elongator complex protein 3
MLEKLVFKLFSSSNFTKSSLAREKRKWAKIYGYLPKNSAILKEYKKLLKQDKVSRSQALKKILLLKKVRSLSGIVPVAVLTKPYFCPGRCIYCPTQEGIPKSYLDDEPAVMRAQMADFDPYLQVKRRLKQLKETGHSVEKIELIVMGGSFASLPKNYQTEFIKKCFDAANNKKSKNLKTAQKINEKAKQRIIGITLETRPDQITEKELVHFRKLGATRFEIGVQSLDDKVLKLVKRGHGVKASVKATRLLKDAGFKVGYHMMPNLPGSSLRKDFTMFKTIFTDSRFMPDMIKIYPCVVTYQAKLYNWFKQRKYKTYNDSQLISLLIKIKKIVPSWVRIMRLGRDIPVGNIANGNKMSNIRQVLKQKGAVCSCIRCREIKGKSKKETEVFLNQTSYKASRGEEFFLEYKDKKERLYALLRLRIPSQIKENKKHFIKELQDCAIIREVHAYGEALKIGRTKKKSAQHKGLGKKLIKKAEQIAKKKNIKKIAVISGIGVRGYYQKLGYKLKSSYMVKDLN